MIMGKRRIDGEEEEEDGDIVDATVVAKGRSPRLGEGLRELIEDRDLREEMKVVKGTIDAMHQLEKTN